MRVRCLKGVHAAAIAARCDRRMFHKLGYNLHLSTAGLAFLGTDPEGCEEYYRAFQKFARSPFYRVPQKRLLPRMRDPASQLPLPAGVSSPNLAFAFFDMFLHFVPLPLFLVRRSVQLFNVISDLLCPSGPLSSLFFITSYRPGKRQREGALSERARSLSTRSVQ